MTTLVAETNKMASISLNLPYYEEGRSFNAWKSKFTGYCELLQIKDDKCLTLLPLCFNQKKFDCIFENIDKKSTLNSILTRLDDFITQETRPDDPLVFFINREWENHETIFQYVRELKHRANFITSHKQAIEDLVRKQLRRVLPPTMAMIASSDTDPVDRIVDILAQLPRPKIESSIAMVKSTETNNGINTTATTTGSTIICYNCEMAGHTSRRCTRTKSTCSTCEKKGHVAKYCRNSSKNEKRGPTNA